MKIILDSNVLFSALIKDSKTRQLILEYNARFLFPSFILSELNIHKKELLKKSGMKKEDFNKLIDLILKKVIIVPDETMLEHKTEALEIVKDIDPDDVIFIACALTHPNSMIWSDDKRLKIQKRVGVLNTKEIIKLFSAMNHFKSM